MLGASNSTYLERDEDKLGDGPGGGTTIFFFFLSKVFPDPRIFPIY